MGRPREFNVHPSPPTSGNGSNDVGGASRMGVATVFFSAPKIMAVYSHHNYHKAALNSSVFLSFTFSKKEARVSPPLSLIIRANTLCTRVLYDQTVTNERVVRMDGAAEDPAALQPRHVLFNLAPLPAAGDPRARSRVQSRSFIPSSLIRLDAGVHVVYTAIRWRCET